MKAMILCAGLGTRLKPWTLKHPKALVPVGGIPMLKRVAENLAGQGFDETTVNVHHFADQIKDYIREGNISTCRVKISDETDALLDTGGGIMRAESFLAVDNAPFLVHNVDILSNADLKILFNSHVSSGRDVTLLVSDRDSSRKLIFERGTLKLKGWMNVTTGDTKPAAIKVTAGDAVYAFSGIYVMSVSVFDEMHRLGFSGKFPIMDFFLASMHDLKVGAVIQNDLELIDIGKPETLRKADLSLS